MVAFGGGKKGQIKGIRKIGRSDEQSIDKVYHVEEPAENDEISESSIDNAKEQEKGTCLLDENDEISIHALNDQEENLERVSEEEQTKPTDNQDTETPNLVLKDYKYLGSHPLDNILTDLNSGITIRSGMTNHCAFNAFLSMIEPKKISEALQDADWIIAMEEELNQFERSKVWNLVPKQPNRTIIGTKWVSRNKLDEHGTITRNKARLVVQG
ncbi:uncharacterized protein LOC125810325 [Solanum verrucosum]|uniref:uncharacterized protein LOC125810325 n=1 Tax=Solanum verrucosum TaxID=315347 RepID=UPI0020D0044C|nr:uncharacterized protein LOC125810325 [Solanum verrucosum]